MFKRIIKKDKNEELERILDEKQIDEQARNLLQGILYKIEVSYNDYQKAKAIEQTEEQYVDQIIMNIKKKCNKIQVVKVSQKLEDEELDKKLREKKFIITEDGIISYPIEEKLLYAIEKKSNNKKILNNKYEEATIAVSDFINVGKDIDRLEVLRDFNGWSWTTVKKEIENIEANLIYQMLQILFGKEFMDNWVQDKDGIVDYFEAMEHEKTKYTKNTIKDIKENLIKIAMINDIKENKEFSDQISKKLREIKKQLKEYEDTEANIERLSEQRKTAMKQLKDIEKILRQESRLMAEYEKRDNIFNIKVLKKEFTDKRNKLLNEISECNYFLNPMNYMKEKKKLEDKKARLDVKRTTKKQQETLKIDFIQQFLKCFNAKIKNSTEQEEIVKLIYQFRYFMCLPYDLENNIKDLEKIREDIEKTEKLLEKKAVEKKVITKVPFEVMQHILETRIIVLEELYYKVEKEEDKYYVQIFDENISEEKFEVKSIENTKTNKKIKIFI